MDLLDKIRGWRNFSSKDVVNQTAINEVMFNIDNSSKLNELYKGLSMEEFDKAYDKIANNYKHDGEGIEVKQVLFFETREQKTYLCGVKSTTFINFGFLLCILDDRKNSKPELKWKHLSLNLHHIGIPENIKFRDSKNDKFGLIDIGDNHKNWYYTKNLFKSEIELLEEIKDVCKWLENSPNINNK